MAEDLRFFLPFFLLLYCDPRLEFTPDSILDFFSSMVSGAIDRNEKRFSGAITDFWSGGFFLAEVFILFYIFFRN